MSPVHTGDNGLHLQLHESGSASPGEQNPPPWFSSGCPYELLHRPGAAGIPPWSLAEGRLGCIDPLTMTSLKKALFAVLLLILGLSAGGCSIQSQKYSAI